MPRILLALALLLATTSASAAPPGAAATGAGLRGASIVLRREACYGPCPIYRVEVRGDGRVRFAGEMFVRTKHPRPYRISRARARALFAAFEKAGFFALPDVAAAGCPCRAATDNPYAKLTLTVGGRTRTLEHDYGCRCVPETLPALARAVDDAARVGRWIGHGREAGLSW